MVDALTTVKTLLTAQWTAGNTDSLTPTIDFVVNRKLVDAANGDWVLLYEVDEGIDPFGIGGSEWAHDNIISCDIRTTYKRVPIDQIRPHLIKVKDEVLRILKANVADPDGDFALAVLRRKKDLSDKNLGVGRMVIDVALRSWG